MDIKSICKSLRKSSLQLANQTACEKDTALEIQEANLERKYEKENQNLKDEYTKKLNVLLQNEKEMQSSIEHMEAIVKDCVQKVGIVRYQAIPNMGADLSYTVALLNKDNDGVVFNGIYGRDGCYTYAKPIKDGKSTYNLSEEEEQAISQAIKKVSTS